MQAPASRPPAIMEYRAGHEIVTCMNYETGEVRRYWSVEGRRNPGQTLNTPMCFFVFGIPYVYNLRQP
jgi:hypothetical protein